MDTAALTAAEVPFRIELVSVDRLDPNPWNPNVMDEPTRAAERESIQTFGFLDPLTVREQGDRFQIIDGEHRWREARELDYSELPCVVIEADEAQAKKLTVILNETRGEADPVLLSTLLKDLRDSVGDEQLRRGLPYSRDELDSLVAIAEDDWTGYAGVDGHSHSPDRDWYALILHLPADLEPAFAVCQAKVAGAADLDPDPRTAAGQVVMAAVRHLVKRGR